LSIAGISLAFWISIWILLFSPILKNVNFEDPNQPIYIVVILILWGIFLIIKERISHLLKRKKSI